MFDSCASEMPDDWEIKKTLLFAKNARAPSLPPKIVRNFIIYDPFLQNCSSNIKASHEKRIKKGKQWRRNHPPIWNNHTHRPSVMLCWSFPSDSSMLLLTCLLFVTYWELSMLSLPAHVHMLLLSNSPCLYLTPMIHNHSSLLALATTIHHSGMVSVPVQI